MRYTIKKYVYLTIHIYILTYPKYKAKRTKAGGWRAGWRAVAAAGLSACLEVWASGLGWRRGQPSWPGGLGRMLRPINITRSP